MESFSIAPPVGGGRSRNSDDPPLGRCVPDAVAASVRLHRWGLGFRQCSFRPITRVLRDGTFSVFQWLPLLWHALFPSSFRLQVNQMTQEHPSGFLLTASGIQHRVPRRTVFPHTALQSVVLPRRGLTGQRMGCFQAIQPMLGKEGVRPALMISPAATSFLAQAFAEDASQPHPDPPVQVR